MSRILSHELPERADAAHSAAGTVEWTCDPWRENARVAGLSACTAVALCALVAAAHVPFLVFAGLCAFVIAAFAPAFTVVRCRADREGVARRGWFGWERRAWKDVRRVERLSRALLCSPYASRHPLDSARALSLPLPAAEREALVARIESLRSAHGR
ncbi:MAG: hypothetical protein HZA61_05790 [Candidatus Eisenbacteria bacterium]|uniref:Uncharacterized protein n=1 Tax=Eiseniibacteriota bacterium TaxID=2212470 RepID=A0A933SAI2_UNCEI|nr:hypothetical protein [Candidatus Eisenbacteria bacterium]